VKHPFKKLIANYWPPVKIYLSNKFQTFFKKIIEMTTLVDSRIRTAS
jgi:hypothetical protein